MNETHEDARELTSKSNSQCFWWGINETAGTNFQKKYILVIAFYTIHTNTQIYWMRRDHFLDHWWYRSKWIIEQSEQSKRYLYNESL